MTQDPQVASMVYAWTTFQRHLLRGDPAVTDRWRRSWNLIEEQQTRPRDQGPVHNLKKDLELIRCEMVGEDRTVMRHKDTGEAVELCKAIAKDLKTFLQDKMTMPMLAQPESRAGVRTSRGSTARHSNDETAA